MKPGRRFLFLSGERKRKSAEKRKKASRFGYGEERKRRSCDAKDCFRFHVSCHMLGVLLRLPRQSASAQNADGSALHFHRSCLVSNPAGISQKMHVPIKCCARPCGEGKRVVVPNAVLAVACNHKAPRSGRLAVALPRRHFQLSILQSPFSSSLKIFLPFPQQYAKIYYSIDIISYIYPKIRKDERGCCVCCASARGIPAAAR